MKLPTQRVLLINASNLETFPVYPYAFIQIPAIAGQSDIEVICQDLLGIPQNKWAGTISGLIENHSPAMILVTLRNTDSLNAKDYERSNPKRGDRNAYFPIERTKDLIATIRGCSNLKITVGGFGFSVMPADLMHYLRPDYGVFGDPDGFFEYFNEIQAGNLEQVPNLLYFQEDRLIANQRCFYPPLAQAEYTSQTIEKMMAFYEAFPSPGFQGAPIEIMRGCIHSCVFCSEPHVKGKQVRYRDLTVVMKDIEILADHHITQLYMISSELNPEGNAYVLELADCIHAFNQRQPEDRKVIWFGANYLLKFSKDDYERLYRSGFTGGWFDITAFDDENARAMRTPYRNKSLVTYLETYADFKRKQAIQSGAEDSSIGWTMFLGNPATTIETIRTTLQVANQHSVAQLFDSCGVIAPLRVFAYEEPDEGTLDVTYSVTHNLRRSDYQQILPSYAYPPALIHDWGSEEEIAEIFKHIGDTYLSTKYQKTRQWLHFIQQKASATSITDWFKEMIKMGIHPPAHLSLTENVELSSKLQQLFSKKVPPETEQQTYENLAEEVVAWLMKAGLVAFPKIWEAIGFPKEPAKLDLITPYDLTFTLFKKWSSADEIYAELMEQTSSVHSRSMRALCLFCAHAILYKFNILLTPKHSELFISAN